MINQYRVCSKTVMDTSATDIVFDGNGVSNYCVELENRLKNFQVNPDENKKKLNSFIEKIKESGKRKKYDCIVGVSGGVDSSWVLVKAVEFGLRPLAVHMDNGWNSELAQNNIENLINSLGVDLYTHVINWKEYKAMMQAFFDADVIDVELLYDNAMLAVNYQQAAKYGIKYILSGSNQATEGMRMPPNWNWFKRDKKNIIDICAKKSNVKITTFPLFGVKDHLYYRYIKKILWTSVLDLLDYDKSIAMNVLEEKYGYKKYPYKHYESIFTRFYQGYILPNKFKVDKRRLHFSSLIVSGQMTRDAALEDLSRIPYFDQNTLKNDIEYFLKKMDWTLSDLESYIARPSVPHDFYKSERNFWLFLMRLRSAVA